MDAEASLTPPHQGRWKTSKKEERATSPLKKLSEPQRRKYNVIDSRFRYSCERTILSSAWSHYDALGTKRNSSLTRYGCFIDHSDLFDPEIFKLSAREAAQTDPIHRPLLMTAYESLEIAGMRHGSPASAYDFLVGTFYGQSSDDWREVNSGQEIDIFHTTGGTRAFGPGRLNYCNGREGPSMNIDAACSSSAVAIRLACSSIKAKECNAALARGANIMTASDMLAGLS